MKGGIEKDSDAVQGKPSQREGEKERELADYLVLSPVVALGIQF